MSEEASRGPGEANEVKELKELVAALRDSIMELKAALSDVSNPFLEEPRAQKPTVSAGATPNGSQVTTSPPTAQEGQAEVGERGREQEPPEERAPRVIKVEKPGAGAEVEEERMLVPLSASSQLQVPAASQAPGAQPSGLEGELEALRSVAAGRPRAQASGSRPATAADLKRTLRILRVMYRLARKLPTESLEHYIELMRTLGLVDERTARTVEILKRLVEVSRREGLTPEDHIIALYSLAKMLGVQDRELEEEVAMIMVEKLRGRKQGSNPGAGVEQGGEDDDEVEGGGSQWGLPLQ